MSNFKKLEDILPIDVPFDEIVERIANRRSCKGCSEIYNVVFNPPKVEGICDKCGGELYQRDDDTLENAADIVDDAEKRLYECVKEVSFTNDYENYIKQLIGLNAQIDNFFEKVLVMDKDENIKNNRIALLTILKNYYEKIADFSVLRA